jgi:hypothetical protein
MSWVAVAVGVGSAAAGAYGANQQKKAANQANKGAGKVDITRTTDPWGPSTDYRTDIMGRAQALTNSRPGGTSAPIPATAGGGGGGGKGGGQAYQGPTSSRTNQLADDMAARARSGHALYDPANAYVTNTLGGGDSNAYRSEAADKFRNLNNADLDRYLGLLFSEFEGGGGKGGGGGGGVRISGGGGAGAYQPNQYKPPVGAAEEIKAILSGKYLNEGNPYRDELIDAITKRTQQEYSEEVIPGINSGFAGAGRFGSNAWQEAMGKSAGRYADSLGGTVAQVQSDDYNARMGDLMNALGMGTQYDMAAMDDDTKRWIAAQDAAARSSAASASAGAASADLASRERLAMLNALGGAVGMSTGLTQMGAAGLADVGADFSTDQRFALGSVGELSGLGLRDLGAAGNFSLGIDALGSEDRARRAAASNAAGGLNLQRQMFDFEKYRYGQDAPWNDINRYADLINAMSGGYGTVTEQGFDGRSQSQQVAPNVWQQALAGGLAGYGAASNYGGGGGGGGGGGNTYAKTGNYYK